MQPDYHAAATPESPCKTSAHVLQAYLADGVLHLCKHASACASFATTAVEQGGTVMPHTIA